MSDDGWGDDDAGWTEGDAAAAPAAGDEEVEEEEKPRGVGDGKCRNCRQVQKIYNNRHCSYPKVHIVKPISISGRALCFRLPRARGVSKV